MKIIPMLITKLYIICIPLLALNGCSKFIDVDLAGSTVTTDIVFSDDFAATSAVIGIYFDLSTSAIGSGITTSLGRTTGLSADELYDFRRTPAGVELELNNINATNSSVAGLWNSLYKVIYSCNSLLEGLDRSTGITPDTKKRLTGEARFARAFCYFNLTNLFSDVPLVLTTDYNVNSIMPRTDQALIYSQIVTDLTEAKQLLEGGYAGLGRTRANSFAASALLAKVYLFLEEWEKAETEASLLIDNPLYQLHADMRDVFKIGSLEAIWQLAPEDNYNSTDEARYYFVATSPRYLLLRKEFVESFDNADLRRSTWIGVKATSAGNVFFPHKYTTQATGLPIQEYSAVLRLAEQYLIRAEARVHLEKLPGAISDLDFVRERAGLSSIEEEQPAIESNDMLLLIQDEKKHELFTEYGNRWFDLKRLDRAVEILSAIKTGFTKEDELYPIPADERRRNPNMGQNDGY